MPAFGFFIISSCSSNTDLIRKIDRVIEVETRKIEDSTKDAKIGIQQLKFISLELEAVKLNSNKVELTKSSKEISEQIHGKLTEGKQREFEDSISKVRLDSLFLKKNELIKN